MKAILGELCRLTNRCGKRSAALLLVALFLAGLAVAAERRARPPQDDDPTFGGIFFEDVSERVAPNRPPINQLSSRSQPIAATESEASQPEPTDGSGWASMIAPVSLEDEVKRLTLHYDGVITSPGAFKSGGYADARVDLSVLAMLFAVIAEHSGDVRWKSDAAAARDLLARTARNSSSGAIQVYNEAKLRKQDLQDLLRGAGIENRQADAESDWGVIIDRSPLMEYIDRIYYDQLSSLTASESDFKDSLLEAQRYAELIAVAGHVLTKDAMPEGEDPDYQMLAEAMTKAALDVRAAVQREDAEAAREATGAIGQACDSCHEVYR